MYVSITLNGKEVFFFFKTKIKNVNCIFTKTAKNNSQKGKEITEQIIFIDLMLNGLYKLFGSKAPDLKVPQLFYRKDNCAGVPFSSLLLGGI